MNDNDRCANLILKKSAQEVKARKLQRRPEKEPARVFCVCIPLDKEEEIRESQARYYLSTHNIANGRILTFDTPNEFFDTLTNSGPIDELQILCHGDDDGNIVFPGGVTVPMSSIFESIKLRANSTGLKKHIWIHCFGYKSVSSDDAAMNFILKTQAVVGTSPNNPVTYNIPQVFANGSNTGWVHSSLNPEILNDPLVKQYLPLAEQRGKLSLQNPAHFTAIINLEQKISQIKEQAKKNKLTRH